MAIFSAGCIEKSDDLRTIRQEVYRLARHDLDSPSIKISARRHHSCINYIAFLPKERLVQENILRAVSQSDDRVVVMFELDYKHVGVVCEYQRIIDYILDKPEEFARERGYKTKFVDNSDGAKLLMLNLTKDSREAKAAFGSLAFVIFLTSVIFYVGYQHLLNIPINKGNQKELQVEYEKMVKNEFSRSAKMVHKVDTVKVLDDVESLTKITKSYLRNITYKNAQFCVSVKTPHLAKFSELLPRNTKIKDMDYDKNIVNYCYEKI
ncbi:MAG: hypothetical protein U9N42_11255 [Campylobacterota bacterium]|nr:hypothetical protein [Campylobacterota bacterium]